MKFSRRVVVSILFAVIILLAGVLFWPFILNDFIKPMGLVAWLLLRLLVLSVDQKYFWIAVIFVVLVFLLRLLPTDQTIIQSEDLPNTNVTTRNIEYWHSLFMFIDQNGQDDKILKKELARLLHSFYATKQRTSADFRLYDALEQGEIPIPEQIHTFLFLEEQQETGGIFKKMAQSIRNAPRKWKRRWIGQEIADHYRMIDQILCFMETSLEMKNDNEEFNSNKH
jgi:hypothetical protein